MNLLPIDFSFVQELVSLSWSDALWGYERQMIGWPAVVDLAKNRLCEDANALEIELSCAGKSDTSRIGELLRALAASESEGLAKNSEKKWLYVVLAWAFANRDRLEDPLGTVETIYADFEYPSDIENFVRYMPPADGYEPSEYTKEANQQRLIKNWEEYLDAARGEVGMRAG